MWGISFVWMKDILDQQDVYSFLTSRFLVAAAAMILLKPKVLKAFSKELVFKGLIVGMALGSGAYPDPCHALRLFGFRR